VFETLIGLFMAILALLPTAKFYPGRLGTKQVLAPIEPAWVGRLFIGGLGLAAILDGVWRMHR
jgi:hypothetical protein